MLTRRKIQTNVLLIIGIVILINIIAAKFFFRLDFTSDQRYSLSDATTNILENLDEPVTVIAYFTEDLPPDIAKVKNDFQDLLIEYSNASDGNVVYEFVNPTDQETEMKAQQAGIAPIMINVRERDQMKQQRAYLGAIVQLGENKEVIPLIQPGAAMEFELSTNIKKLTVDVKPKIGLLQGFGSPTLAAMQQVNQQLSVLYDVQPVVLSDTASIPTDIQTLLVVAPKDSVPGRYFNQLDEYLNRGSNMVLAINRVDGDLSTAQGSAVKTGFEEWLSNKGITIEENFVVDAQSAQVQVQQQVGPLRIPVPVQFPYLPIINNFTGHPVTNGLETVVLQFASSISLAPRDTTVKMVPIALTSEKSGSETPPLYFNVNRKWRNADFLTPSLTVGVAVEGKIAGSAESKMVVFSDGDFVINGEGQQAQQLQADNVNMFVNAVDWLSDDTGLIDLRTKGVTSRPIDPTLEDGTKLMLKYLNFLLPILLIIVYGIFRWQIRKTVKNKLMNSDYA